MTSKLTVRMGGGTADPTVDYTSVIPYFEPGGQTTYISGGGMWDNGGMSQGEAIIVDDAGEIPRADDTRNLAGHNQILWTEDAPGCETLLAYGRRNTAEKTRGDHPWGDSQTLHFTWDDQNWELRGQPIDPDVYPTGWSRPSETDVARVTAVVTTFLQRSPRYTTNVSTDLIVNANTVTMPAKVYAPGTELGEILADCATAAGKGFGIVKHHGAAGSASPGYGGYGVYNADTDLLDPGSGVLKMTLARGAAVGQTVIVPVIGHADDGSRNVSGIDSRGNTWTQVVKQTGPPGTTATMTIHWMRCDVTHALFAGDGLTFSWTSPGSTVPDYRSGMAYVFNNVGTYVNGYVNGGFTNAPGVSITSSNGNLVIVCVDSEGAGLPEPGGTVPEASTVYEHIAGPVSGWNSLDSNEPTVAAAASGSGEQWAAWRNDYAGGSFATTINNADGSLRTRDWVTGAVVFSTGDGTITSNNFAQPATGCSYLSMLYTIPTDYTTFASTVKISVDPADINPTGSPPVFAPIEDQGPLAIADGSDLPVSKVISSWANGTATAYQTADAGTAIVNLYDYYAVAVNDSLSVTSGQAAARATAVLHSLSTEHVTGQVTVMVDATQVNLLSEGMPIQVKEFGGGQYLGTYQDRRIASLKWEPASPETGGVFGKYYAHMQLDRPQRIVPLALPGSTGVSTGGAGSGSSASVSGSVNAAAIAALEAEIAALTGFVTTTGGGTEPVKAHGNMGSTETINLVDGDIHTGTLNADCTLSFTGFVGPGGTFALKLTQDGTGGWDTTFPSSVVNRTALSAALDQTAGDYQWLVFISDDTGTSYTGYIAGSGGSSVTFGTPSLSFGTSNTAGATDEVIRRDAGLAIFDATVPVTQAFSDTAATGSAAFAARRDHKHGMPASPSVTAGQLVISDTPSTPLVFADILQNEAQDDFIYADP